MKIHHQNLYVNKVYKKVNTEQVSPETNKVQPQSENPNQSDHVEISSQVKRVQDLVKQAALAQEDDSRVKEIREKIASGEYRIDNRKLAEKMLKLE